MILLVCLLVHLSVATSVLLNTSSGQVEGFVDLPSKSHVFLGIPYASAERWQLPTDVAPWSGVRPATNFSAGCPQNCLELFKATCPQIQSEDCLGLNVFVPPSVDSSALLPAVLYLPGGDFKGGTAMSDEFYAAQLAVALQAVVVTANYRLGVLGFLQLSGESISENLAIEDQRMALRWVQKNALALGIDASQVTLMGQSAGASSVAFHLTQPGSQGLFHRAISESNPMANPMKSLDEAKKQGDVFEKMANCSDMQCLENLPLSELLAAQALAENHFRLLHPLLILYAWSPVVEHQPMAVLTQGKGLPVPVLWGSNANETNFLIGSLPNESVSEAEYLAAVALLFPLHIASVLKQFPPHREANVTLSLTLLATDYLFVCSNRLAWRGHSANSYAYVFRHPMSFATQFWGADYPCYNATCHAGELPFVFQSATRLGYSITAAEKVLENKISNFWGAFVHGQAPWASYKTATDQYMLLSTTEDGYELISHYRSSDCDFLADLYGNE